MQKNDKKEFSSKYTLNYECFKEFSKGYQAVRKALYCAVSFAFVDGCLLFNC